MHRYITLVIFFKKIVFDFASIFWINLTVPMENAVRAWIYQISHISKILYVILNLSSGFDKLNGKCS